DLNSPSLGHRILLRRDFTRRSPAAAVSCAMRFHRRFAAIAAIWCLPLLACGAALLAADRPARVITPQGSPVWLDPQRTLLFDSPAVSVMRRNEFTAPVNYALRIWVLDERSDVK